MAQGDGVVYNHFKDEIPQARMNLATDVIKLILVSGYTPDIDNHTVYADVSAQEYGAGLGYTVGGETLGGQSVTKDAPNDRSVFNANDVTWSTLGPLSPAIPSHCIMFDDTPTAPDDPLMFYWEIGVTATNGGDYTIQWNPFGICLFT